MGSHWSHPLGVTHQGSLTRGHCGFRGFTRGHSQGVTKDHSPGDTGVTHQESLTGGHSLGYSLGVTHQGRSIRVVTH